MKKEQKKKGNFFANILSGFHETTLTYKRNNKSLLFLVLCYLLSYTACSFISDNTDMDSSLLILVSFLLSEVIPVIILLGFINIKRNGQKVSLKQLLTGIKEQIKKWSKIFLTDIKKKWVSLIFLLVSTEILLILVNIVSVFLVPSNSPTNVIKQANGSISIFTIVLSIVAPLLIAPIFEEIFYRRLLSTALGHFFSNAFGTKAGNAAAYLFSALFFTAQHNISSQASTLVYIAFALFLQYIANRSKSLTAPIMIHILYNLLAVVF